MKAMLFGGSGFLGLSIAKHLHLLGVHVVVVDHPARLARTARDLQDYEVRVLTEQGAAGIDLVGADILIYLSSATLPSTSMLSLSHDAEANISPALKTFEHAAACGVRRIVFASSGGTVYGPARSLPIREDHPTAPISAYGVSKLAIERYLAVMSHVSGIDAISLRIANPYGPYQFRGVGVGAIARFLQHAYAGETIEIWGDGKVIRDYIYVDDVAKAFGSASLVPGLPTGDYNVGSGKGVGLNELIEAISVVCRRDLKVVHRPARVFDVPEVVLDCERLSSKTGWRPSVSFSEGLERMWDQLCQRQS